MATQTYTLKRGDRWDLPIIFRNSQNTSFDWTGTIVRAHLRSGDPDGPLVHDFSPTASYPNAGNMAATLTITGNASANLPVDTLYGDVEVSRNSPSLGPYTWLDFTITLAADATH